MIVGEDVVVAVGSGVFVLVGEGVLVGRDLLAEYGEPGIPIALRNVAEDLVVGSVLLDDVEHMPDRRAGADLRWNDGRCGRRFSRGQQLVMVWRVLIDPLGMLANLRF